MAHPTIELVPRGPFSLRAAASFGFGPTEGRAAAFEDGVLRYAFAVDSGGYAGVELTQPEHDGPVLARVHGDGDLEAVERQLSRVLSLDHDGDLFLGVGERDPVIGELQRAHPGQRPVLFFSPWEAAAWAVISLRQRGVPAASVRRSLAERHGQPFELSGTVELAFPPPERLLDGALDVPGLNEEKQARLRSLAEAAHDGLLDVRRLRELGPENASRELQQLRGIGPFYAGLIVLRACGFTDAPLSVAEPKLLAQLERLYRLDAPPDLERYRAIAEQWRPFRAWVGVLVRLAGEHGHVPAGSSPG